MMLDDDQDHLTHQSRLDCCFPELVLNFIRVFTGVLPFPIITTNFHHSRSHLKFQVTTWKSSRLETVLQKSGDVLFLCVQENGSNLLSSFTVLEHSLLSHTGSHVQYLELRLHTITVNKEASTIPYRCLVLFDYLLRRVVWFVEFETCVVFDQFGHSATSADIVIAHCLPSCWSFLLPYPTLDQPRSSAL